MWSKMSNIKYKIDIFCRLTFIYLFLFSFIRMFLNSNLLSISGDVICVFCESIKRERKKWNLVYSLCVCVNDKWSSILTNKGHLVVRFHFRPSDQGEPVDKIFLLQLQEASHWKSLILESISTTQVSAEKTTWWAANSLGDSWSQLGTTFWFEYWTDPSKVKCCWTWWSPMWKRL